MSKVSTKMIKVTSRGIVTTSRGKVSGPINFPYRESVDKIWNMLTMENATVYEQLLDRSFIKLDIQNFDENNNISKTAMEVHEAMSRVDPRTSLTGTNVGELGAKQSKRRNRRNRGKRQHDENPTNTSKMPNQQTMEPTPQTDPEWIDPTNDNQVSKDLTENMSNVTLNKNDDNTGETSTSLPNDTITEADDFTPVN